MEKITKINFAFIFLTASILLILAEYDMLEKIGKFLFPIFLAIFYLGQYTAKYANPKK
jgi:branched-subunit amino acid permease